MDGAVTPDRTGGLNLARRVPIELRMWEMLNRIHCLDREALMRELLDFRGRIRLDFTPKFLEGRTDEQLRHLLAAAYLQSEQRSDVAIAG